MTEPILPPENESVSPESSPAPTLGKFEHRGLVGELFPIVLANLFYKVITLGLYHFWGKTRVRRYLWSRTTFAGEPFEYTGEGIQLCKGLLISLRWLLPFFIIFGLILYSAWGGQGDPWVPRMLPVISILLIYPYVIFLMGYGRYSARKYFYGHTRWRGIRLGLSGSAKDHAWKGLGYTFLTGVTLGIYTPFMRNHLAANFINHTWIGDRPLHYPVGDNHKVAFIGRFWGMVAMGTVYGVIGNFLLKYFLEALLANFISALDGPDKPSMLVFQLLVYTFVAIYNIPFAMIWFWYRAGEIRAFINNTRLEGAKLHLEFPTGPFVWLRTSNIIAVVLTLGLAYPWAAVRTARFFANHTSITGTLDLSSIGQSSEAVLREGEGLAEVFDLGII